MDPCGESVHAVETAGWALEYWSVTTDASGRTLGDALSAAALPGLRNLSAHGETSVTPAQGRNRAAPRVVAEGAVLRIGHLAETAMALTVVTDTIGASRQR